MVIAHNLSALNTYKSLGIASSASTKSMEKLSSGYRINRAGDDAAGLSISEKMRSQIRGLNRASRNAQDGISMIQTAEGALNEQHSILQRMREIAVQAASDTNQDTDREALQNEISQLTSEINRIGNTTEFNGMKLLDGSMDSKTVNGTTTAVAKAGKVELQYAKGVTADFDIASGIKIGTGSDNVDYTNLQAAADANTITITKKGDTFTVDITMTEAATDDVKNAGLDVLSVQAEEMVKNNDGSYTYNNHAISFTISAEEAKGLEDNDAVTIDLFNAKGADNSKAVNASEQVFGTRSDYDDTNTTGSLTVTNFNLDAYAANGAPSRLDVAKVKIEATADETDASVLTVTLMDKDGNPLVVDTVNNKTGIADSEEFFKYDANGVSFNIKSLGAKDGDKLTAEIDLTEKLGTENVTVGGKIEDNSAYFHVGANSNQTIAMSFGDMRAASLGIVGTGEGFASVANVTDGVTSVNSEYSLDVSTREGANKAIDIIDSAIQKVSDERSKYGAVQNRLEYTINNLNTSAENLQAAESRIRDVDMASEMMELTKNNILQQAAQAMLVQANQTPQQALQLLQ